jgi:hypothetical protein
LAHTGRAELEQIQPRDESPKNLRFLMTANTKSAPGAISVCPLVQDRNDAVVIACLHHKRDTRLARERAAGVIDIPKRPEPQTVGSEHPEPLEINPKIAFI